MMVSISPDQRFPYAGFAVSVFPEWRFPAAGIFTLDAERAGCLLSASLLRLNILFGLAYGEDVMDAERSKRIGKRITLPALTDEEADELLRKWQSKAAKDSEGNTIITVYPREEM